MSDRLKIVFMGTPDFAVDSLEALLGSDHEVAAVFTQPDKPKNRGHKVIPTPVKIVAEEHNIPVYQPLSLRKGETAEEAYKVLCDIAPDIIIVVAYGQILPKNILDLPPMGCVNIHGSLLPEYRGAAPIEQAVLDGKTVTGVTSMYMGEGLDSGDMLLKKSTEIGENETGPELRERLGKLGAELLLETLEGLTAGTVTPEKQDETKASHCGKLTKDMSKLDFSKPAAELHNVIRAITGFAFLDGKRLKVYGSELCGSVSGKAGEICDTENFVVACGDGRGLKFTSVQPEGKKQMPVQDFLRGKKIEKGTVLE